MPPPRCSRVNVTVWNVGIRVFEKHKIMTQPENGVSPLHARWRNNFLWMANFSPLSAREATEI